MFDFTGIPWEEINKRHTVNFNSGLNAIFICALCDQQNKVCYNSLIILLIIIFFQSNYIDIKPGLAQSPAGQSPSLSPVAVNEQKIVSL